MTTQLPENMTIKETWLGNRYLTQLVNNHNQLIDYLKEREEVKKNTLPVARYMHPGKDGFMRYSYDGSNWFYPEKPIPNPQSKNLFSKLDREILETTQANKNVTMYNPQSSEEIKGSSGETLRDLGV